MLFRKIHFPRTPDNPQPHANWYMILRNEDDIVSYLESDSWSFAQAMFSPSVENYPANHPASMRVHTAKVLRDLAEKTSNGRKVWPHELCANHLHQKGMGMMKLIRHGEIQVNEAGGYCLHESFLRTWSDAQVVKETEQESKIFPEKDRGKVAGQKFGF
jgi:hypothetical protein